jgi:hypothetical protein
LPDKPNYGSGYENDREEVINLQWIAPRKSVEIGSYDISSFRIGAPDLEKDVVEGRRRLHLYSAVKYRGILEGKYTLRTSANLSHSKYWRCLCL